MDCSPLGSSGHEILQDNTGVGWHALLQGIFLTQGLNLGLLCLQHWQVDFLPLCHLGSRRLGNKHPGTELGSSVSPALAGRFFTTVPPGISEAWEQAHFVQG